MWLIFRNSCDRQLLPLSVGSPSWSLETEAHSLSLTSSESVLTAYLRTMCSFMYQQPLVGSIRKTRARHDLLQPLAFDCIIARTHLRWDTTYQEHGWIRVLVRAPESLTRVLQDDEKEMSELEIRERHDLTLPWRINTLPLDPLSFWVIALENNRWLILFLHYIFQ